MRNMKSIRIIRDTKYLAPKGLSIDEALLLSVSEDRVQNTIRFYYFASPSVVLGMNQDINDVNLKYIRESDMSLTRRLTGGGVIIIGCPRYTSQMGVSMLFKLGSEIPRKLSHKFKLFSSIILDTLKNLGLQPQYNRNSDITINGKKIAGNGIYEVENALLFHSVILFEFDFDRMLKVLNPKKIKEKEKIFKLMKAKLTTLNLELKKNISTKIVEDEIINSVGSNWSGKIFEDKLSEFEKITANDLLQKKYGTNEWILQSLEHEDDIRSCFVPQA